MIQLKLYILISSFLYILRVSFTVILNTWEQRKLGDLAEIVRGASPRPISDPKWFDNNSNVGWLRIADVTAQDGRIRYLEQKISELGQEKTRVIKTPHLLLSIAATVGKPVINYVPTGVHDGFLIFLNPKFNILYIFWWLEMFREKWNKYGQPGSQVNLNSDLVKNQVINIPNEKEQEKISSFLEALDKIITLHQRKLEHLNLKKKALLQNLFPKNGERYPELRFPGFTDAWEQRKFKDIAFKRGKISEADLPYIEFEDINSGIGTLNKNILQKVGHKKGILFEAGDVLFGKLRPYLQNWLLCQFMGIAVGDFWVFQPQIVSSAFLYYLIQSEAYQSVANISSGTKMPRSSWSLVSESRFSIPKYKEATMIGEFFTSIDKNITLHQRKLEHLQLQKKALLQQMFV